jgi:hypothetical protein
MTTQLRRSAGSRSMSDLLRHPSELVRYRLWRTPFGDPAADRAELRSGTPILVSASLYDGTRTHAGELILQANVASPIIWRARAGWRKSETLIYLKRPIRWLETRPRVGRERWKIKSVFAIVELADTAQQWIFAVPKSDVELVRLAVSLA